MVRDYDEHFGTFDSFNKEVYVSLIGGTYPKIKSIEIDSEFLLKLDFVENSFYVTGSIPVYITIQGESEDIVHLVLLNEDIYLEPSYDSEDIFEARIKEINTELRDSLLGVGNSIDIY